MNGSLLSHSKRMMLELDDLESLLDLRKEVLFLFEKYFGFERSIFWLCSEDQKIFDPVSRNTPAKVLDHYTVHYSQQDFLLPSHVAPLLSERRVLKIEDVISRQEYENSCFFNEFMKPNDHYHEIGIYLISQNKLLGGISFVGERNDPSFHTHSIDEIEVVSYFISMKLNYLLRQSPIHKQAHLTPSEQKVCGLLKKGLTNQEMADQLVVSLNTIKKHLQNIYKKLGVSNRTSLLSFLMP